MRSQRLITLPLLLLCALALVCGCQHTSQATQAALPPGAINTFDADSYRVLSDAHAAIQSIQQSAAGGKLEVNAGQKLILNRMIDDSNMADHLWKAYHAGAGGESTDQLAQAIQVVIGDLASLAKLYPTNGAAKTAAQGTAK